MIKHHKLSSSDNGLLLHSCGGQRPEAETSADMVTLASHRLQEIPSVH